MGKEKLGGGLLAATGIGVPLVAQMMGLTIPAPWGWFVLALFAVLGVTGLLMIFWPRKTLTPPAEPTAPTAENEWSALIHLENCEDGTIEGNSVHGDWRGPIIKDVGGKRNTHRNNHIFRGD